MSVLLEIICLVFSRQYWYIYRAVIFLPEQFLITQESIRIQVQSAAVAKAMSDLLIKAADTTPDCRATTG